MNVHAVDREGHLQRSEGLALELGYPRPVERVRTRRAEPIEVEQRRTLADLLIGGEGDAQAIEIYADSFNRAPEFYEFYRTLEAYKVSFKDKQDILILKSDSPFFKYIRGNVLNVNNSSDKTSKEK